MVPRVTEIDVRRNGVPVFAELATPLYLGLSCGVFGHLFHFPRAADRDVHANTALLISISLGPPVAETFHHHRHGV
jgi:hypothetical protein